VASVGHGYGFGSGSSDPDPNPGKPAPAPAGSRVSTGCGSKVIRALGMHQQAPRYSLGHYCPVTTTGNWFVLLEMEFIHLSGLYNYFFKLICGIQWYFVRNRHGVVLWGVSRAMKSPKNMLEIYIWGVPVKTRRLAGLTGQ
jgi:hypothetical protein